MDRATNIFSIKYSRAACVMVYIVTSAKLIEAHLFDISNESENTTNKIIEREIIAKMKRHRRRVKLPPIHLEGVHHRLKFVFVVVDRPHLILAPVWHHLVVD